MGRHGSLWDATNEVHVTSISKPSPHFRERHRLTWGSEDGTAIFERIHDARFRTFLMTAGDPSNWPASAGWAIHPELPQVDGVAAVEIICGEVKYGEFSLELLLAEPLPQIQLTWSGVPAPPGEISFDDALTLAASMGYDIAIDSIQETATYFLFPMYQIGSCGALVEKRGGRLVRFGSAYSMEYWLWGYENGLLDEPPGDLAIVDVLDCEHAITLLRALHHPLGYHLSTAGVRSNLPFIVPGGGDWLSIRALWDAGDAVRWEIRRDGLLETRG